MSNVNLSIWDKIKQPPSTALKQIGAGRLKGKTDINPQWRYLVMTENFGPCGIGWKYEINRTWTEPATDGQVMAFAEIHLYIKVDDKWSDSIPGIGGSMAIAKERSGMHVSDECYKMAITDALSVAMKMLGVAADIYAGLWNGSRYVDQPKPSTSPKQQHKQTAPKRMMADALRAAGLSDAEMVKLATHLKSKNKNGILTVETMVAVSKEPQSYINEWNKEKQETRATDNSPENNDQCMG